MFTGQLHGLFHPDDTDLFAIWPNQAYLGNSDPLVDAGFSADASSKDSYSRRP